MDRIHLSGLAHLMGLINCTQHNENRKRRRSSPSHHNSQEDKPSPLQGSGQVLGTSRAITKLSLLMTLAIQGNQHRGGISGKHSPLSSTKPRQPLGKHASGQRDHHLDSCLINPTKHMELLLAAAAPWFHLPSRFVFSHDLLPNHLPRQAVQGAHPSGVRPFCFRSRRFPQATGIRHHQGHPLLPEQVINAT